MICKIACCDDELDELKHLKKYFETIMIQTDLELEVDYFTSGEILLQKYKKEQKPYDLLILDMEMPDTTGMELAKEIRESRDRDVLILFLTSYPQYMQQSFYVQAFQYMMKPISFDAFKEEIVRAYQYIREDERSLVFVSTEQGELVVRTRNILCIEKEKGMAMMRIVTTDDTTLARGNLNELEETLAGQPFLRISRSCLVNMDHIFRFQDKDIELDNGKLVTMSRRKVTEIKDIFTRYAVLGGML